MDERIEEILNKLDPKDQEIIKEAMKQQRAAHTRSAIAAIMVRNLSHGLRFKT